MSRWMIAALTLTLGCAGFSPSAQAADEPLARPNILFILSDDQRWDTIHALGNPEIKTPALDGLVARGFSFGNAYCQGSMVGAVCLPSRTMIATGRSLWRIPKNLNAKQAPPGVPLLPALLNEAGYATFHSGKGGNACKYANAAFQTNRETQQNPNSTVENAGHVLDFLSKHDGAQPFFVYLAPPVPHDPRIAPPEYLKLYEAQQLSLSKNFLERHPFDNGDLAIRDELLAPIPRTPDEMRNHLRDYYATISHFDAQVGRILQTVADRGWSENTIVIYASDQGLAVGGRHGLMGKQNLYEHVKPPLLIAGPGVPHGASNALVYLYDLFPTILDLAGAKTPDVIEGKSLLPIAQGKREKVRDSLLGAYKDCQRMVRDDRWKLIVYRTPGERHTQLFDLQTDPDELHNLADEPAHRVQRERLETLLSAERKAFGDPIDFDADLPAVEAKAKR
ncbi:MAG TPA: sulfatase-like hydrolase/transferase [Pirellulales bacterium]